MVQVTGIQGSEGQLLPSDEGVCIVICQKSKTKIAK